MDVIGFGEITFAGPTDEKLGSDRRVDALIPLLHGEHVALLGFKGYSKTGQSCNGSSKVASARLRACSVRYPLGVDLMAFTEGGIEGVLGMGVF